MDNNSTTRVDPRVLETHAAVLFRRVRKRGKYHSCIWLQGREAVELARSHIAELLHVDSKSIIFTSGATESNNTVLKGVMWASAQGSHLIVNAAEHKAILDPAKSSPARRIRSDCLAG